MTRDFKSSTICSYSSLADRCDQDNVTVMLDDMADQFQQLAEELYRDRLIKGVMAIESIQGRGIKRVDPSNIKVNIVKSRSGNLMRVDMAQNSLRLVP